DADPAFCAHVRRNEETLAVRLDQDLLDHSRCFDPDRDMAAIVMIVVGHGEHTAASYAKRTLSPRLFLQSLRKSETELQQLLYYPVGIVVHAWVRHVTSSGSLRFDHAEPGRSRNHSGKLESRAGCKRAEFGLGALPATGTYEHVDIIGGGATSHVGLIDA